MNVLIIGGGVIGITASILMKKKGYDVTVIEKNKTLGGLLSSVEAFDNTFLDYGSHVPRETGIQELDDILFENLSNEQWNKYKYANVGNFFKDKLNTDSAFINVSNQNKETINNILNQIINQKNSNPVNLNEGLKSHFGEYLSEEIYVPLMKKLLGDIDFNLLYKDSYNLFGYSRFIIANSFETEKLKQDPFLDERIAYINNKIGTTNKKIYYPKEPGIFKWVEQLKEQGEALGVKFLTEEYAINIDFEKKVIKTNKEEKYNFDKIIWTLQPELLKKLIEPNYNIPIKEFRGVNVVHFKYRGDLLTDNHYLYCNDPFMKIFRVTLYDNLTQNNVNCCTVEILGEKVEKIDSIIFDELKYMRVISEDAELIDFKHIYVKNGFPIPYKNKKINLPNFEEIIVLEKDYKNFFMEDLLKKMYTTLKKID